MTRPTTGPSPTGTVVVPAYNEAAVIATSLPLVGQTLRDELADFRWEIVVVDDGSVDGTAELAEGCRAALDRLGVELRILRHHGNRGLGIALQTAYAASRGDVVVVVDCDLSYEPSHIPRMVRALAEHDAQVVLASPYMPGGRTIGIPAGIERRSRMANAFLGALGNTRLATMTGMVRAYRGRFIRALSLKSIDVEINIETVYKAELLRARTVEIPATLDWTGLSMRAGRSRLRSRNTRWKIYRTILSGILFRPYMLFLAAGLVTFGLGLLLLLAGLALPADRILLMVWSAGGCATGILLCFASLLSMQMKRYFDELFVHGFRATLRRDVEEARPDDARVAA